MELESVGGGVWGSMFQSQLPMYPSYYYSNALHSRRILDPANSLTLIPEHLLSSTDDPTPHSPHKRRLTHTHRHHNNTLHQQRSGRDKLIPVNEISSLMQSRRLLPSIHGADETQRLHTMNDTDVTSYATGTSNDDESFSRTVEEKMKNEDPSFAVQPLPSSPSPLLATSRSSPLLKQKTIQAFFVQRNHQRRQVVEERRLMVQDYEEQSRKELLAEPTPLTTRNANRIRASQSHYSTRRQKKEEQQQELQQKPRQAYSCPSSQDKEQEQAAWSHLSMNTIPLRLMPHSPHLSHLQLDQTIQHNRRLSTHGNATARRKTADGDGNGNWNLSEQQEEGQDRVKRTGVNVNHSELSPPPPFLSIRSLLRFIPSRLVQPLSDPSSVCIFLSHYLSAIGVSADVIDQLEWGIEREYSVVFEVEKELAERREREVERDRSQSLKRKEEERERLLKRAEMYDSLIAEGKPEQEAEELVSYVYGRRKQSTQPRTMHQQQQQQRYRRRESASNSPGFRAGRSRRSSLASVSRRGSVSSSSVRSDNNGLSTAPATSSFQFAKQEEGTALPFVPLAAAQQSIKILPSFRSMPSPSLLPDPLVLALLLVTPTYTLPSDPYFSSPRHPALHRYTLPTSLRGDSANSSSDSRTHTAQPTASGTLATAAHDNNNADSSSLEPLFPTHGFTNTVSTTPTRILGNLWTLFKLQDSRHSTCATDNEAATAANQSLAVFSSPIEDLLQDDWLMSPFSFTLIITQLMDFFHKYHRANLNVQAMAHLATLALATVNQHSSDTTTNNAHPHQERLTFLYFSHLLFFYFALSDFPFFNITDISKRMENTLDAIWPQQAYNNYSAHTNNSNNNDLTAPTSFNNINYHSHTEHHQHGSAHSSFTATISTTATSSAAHLGSHPTFSSKRRVGATLDSSTGLINTQLAQRSEKAQEPPLQQQDPTSTYFSSEGFQLPIPLSAVVPLPIPIEVLRLPVDRDRARRQSRWNREGDGPGEGKLQNAGRQWGWEWGEEKGKGENETMSGGMGEDAAPLASNPQSPGTDRSWTTRPRMRWTDFYTPNTRLRGITHRITSSGVSL